MRGKNTAAINSAHAGIQSAHELIACASQQIRHPRHSEVKSIRTRVSDLSQVPIVSFGERNRGQVESDAGFEPLLDVVEAARLLRIHP